MTENKQITIYNLLPLLKFGWVAMEPDGVWWWFSNIPRISETSESWIESFGCDYIKLSKILNIVPFDGDWKDSLMEVK